MFISMWAEIIVIYDILIVVLRTSHLLCCRITVHLLIGFHVGVGCWDGEEERLQSIMF